MRRESTTFPGNRPDANNTEQAAAPRLGRPILAHAIRLLAAMALGGLLLALAYQIPVTHAVDVGGYDSAYVQGFYDPERNTPTQHRPELDGSDGSARWTRDRSYLLLPQAGLPARVTLRLRGWRASGAPPEVSVLLNGTETLAQFQPGPDWQDVALTIDGGLLKPNDVVIEIRSQTARLDQDDPRTVGVLLDSATYQVGPAPIVPYPPQLAYGALAAGLLYLFVASRGETRRRGFLLPLTRSPALLIWLAGVALLAVAFLALYRAQPPYPYPLLRLLPAVDALLAALLALRYGPALGRRFPALLDAAALGGIGAWLAALLLAARDHVTLSTPGVEKDFRVFAQRAEQLSGIFQASGKYSPDVDGVLRADGFYNLGYPLLLWLIRPLTSGNAFLAARLVAALSGALLLLATWLLARRLLGRAPALLAAMLLALSPLAVECALYVGTDMPFAATCALAIALIVAVADQRPRTSGRGADKTDILLAVGGGAVAGLAFLVRHPGLLLLPFGWLALWLGNPAPRAARLKRVLLPFTLAFLLAIAPQVAVNLRDTGVPLYSQQAKNVWQGVFGQGDWGRWGEAANSITVAQVLAQDPGRFLANWWANIRGYLGTGGEDTREFGQAVQLRLLGFPANWLAIAGLLGWLVAEGKRQLAKGRRQSEPSFSSYLLPFTLLLAWIGLYVAAVSVGLALQPRFALPLAPIYAVAAAWLVARMRTTDDRRPTNGSRDIGLARDNDKDLDNLKPQAPSPKLRPPRLALPIGLLLLGMLWGGFRIGTSYVLRPRPADEAAVARAEGRAELPGQPADEVGIIKLAQATLRPDERLIVRVDPDVPIGKYSAIAHLTVPAPPADTVEALRASGASYLLWWSGLGQAPAVGPAVGGAGIYTLYRIER